LKIFLQKDSFAVPENFIFEKCKEWAQYQCDIANMRMNKDDKCDNSGMIDYFNSIKYCIRFPNIDAKYFDENVADSCLLDGLELVNLLRYLVHPTKSCHLKKMHANWNCKPRIGLTSTMLLSCNLGLTLTEISNLMKFIPIKYRTHKWQLLCRGSENEFKDCKFHALCDNHIPTITIIKTQNPSIILGGYTEQAWDIHDSADSWINKRDENAFVFLLRKGNNEATYNHANVVPLKCQIRPSRQANAISYRKDRGFGFGDFSIFQTKNVFVDFGLVYDVPTMLHGHHRFTLQEYEVWHLQH